MAEKEIWSDEVMLCLSLTAQEVLDLEDEGVLAQAAEIAADLDKQLDTIENNVAKLHASAWIAERLCTSIEKHCKMIVGMAAEKTFGDTDG